MDTNRQMETILAMATSRRSDLDKRLEEAREKNMLREFEAFKAAGGVLPQWKPRSKEGKRYSTTTESMMKETASRLGEIPSRAEMMKMAKERKMANWNPKLYLGDTKVDYETDARRRVDPNAFKESVAATRDSRNRAKQMKTALTKTQWQLGQEQNR